MKKTLTEDIKRIKDLMFQDDELDTEEFDFDEEVEYEEMTEEGEETTATTTSTASQGYPTVTKWETGVKRGSANSIGNTKWKDSYTLTRGKANTLI